jgi:hypothetical protein
MQDQSSKKDKGWYLIATFKIFNNSTHQFQRWMETDHFPKMHQTGCFAGKVEETEKFLDADSAPGCDVITYTHKFKSKKASKEYQSNPDFREKLIKEYAEKWGTWIGIYIFKIDISIRQGKTISKGKLSKFV